MIRPQIMPSPRSPASSSANNPSPSSRTRPRAFSGVPVPHQAGLTLAFSARPRTWPSPDSTSAKALLEHLDLAPVAHKPGQAPGHGCADSRVDLRRPEELVGLDRLLFSLDQQGIGGSELEELSGQSVGTRGDQDAPRLGGRLHPGGQIW